MYAARISYIDPRNASESKSGGTKIAFRYAQHVR